MDDDVSDAGGVAARVGFKYQDHVAASFVPEMIGDRRIMQVECETSDDITRIIHVNGIEIPEYIQVKTTDRDKKWTATEVYARPNKAIESSLIEKSLLADKHKPNARFRIVTRRSVNATLVALLDPIDRRNPQGEIAALAARLKAKRPKTISKAGHDLAYWTLNTVWDVRAGLDSIESHNMQLISRLAEEFGANPLHSQAKQIYRDLLSMVDKAASASRRDKSKKIISRTAIRSWWDSELAALRATATATMKPYRAKSTQFFVEVHNVQHDGLKRVSIGYDAQYERKVWRSAQLSQYLVTWITELALKAGELAEIDQLNLRQKLEAGLRAVKAHHSLDARALLGEALLHAILRHYFGSEPVACKLFHRSALGDRITRNAHIVHDASGDQLWLGRTYLLDDLDENALFAYVCKDLRETMETEVLREEKQVIIQLREPQHLLSNSLSDAFSPGAPIDLLIKALCIPVLVAYDSAILQAGHTDDYQRRLEHEIRKLADRWIPNLPMKLEEIRVHLIFVPVEKLSALVTQFETEASLA